MSITGDDIKAQIQDDITNYAPKAFHNQRLRFILLQIIAWIDSGGTTGPVVSSTVFPVTSADFMTAVDCPITALNGENIVVFYNATGRFLDKGTEWADLAGGGFTILIAGYDSSVNDANFYVYIAA